VAIRDIGRRKTTSLRREDWSTDHRTSAVQLHNFGLVTGGGHGSFILSGCMTQQTYGVMRAYSYAFGGTISTFRKLGGFSIELEGTLRRAMYLVLAAGCGDGT